MALTAGPVSPIRFLIPERDTWKLRVRVLRVWERAPIGEPSQPYALEMVLMYVEVCFRYLFSPTQIHV